MKRADSAAGKRPDVPREAAKKPTAPLGGFVELAPAPQRCFDECAARMRRVLETAGFAHLDLPAVERAEVLTDKDNWDEIETQMFLFQKGDTKMGLRYDGTVGLARYVAGRANDLVFPFRAYQFAKNFRGERPQRGRYREFYQMDLDILGIHGLSPNYDAEIVAVLSKAYASCGEFIGKTFARVGSRAFWNAMFDYLNLSPEKRRQALVLIDKKDKIGGEFEPALREIAGKKADEILAVFSGGYKQFADKSDRLLAAIKELDDFSDQLAAMGIENVGIDLAIMRGHAYYTGLVFEFFLADFPELGSVGGGGRYEDLVSKFSKTKIIGVGAAIGFSRTLVALLDAGKIDLSGFEDPVDACVLTMGQENTAYGMKVLSELRANGIVAVPFLDTDKKLRNQMEFANKINCKYSIIIGENEVKSEVLTLKNMKNGEQAGKKVADIIKIILKSK
ncbi:MAG: histidine--tRNA ligase [Rickettsiales bacterium]|jgi:histidyl-tRNA synthetase|nr:histidine--tRNA ligase [Rickettsiales bacterium]